MLAMVAPLRDPVADLPANVEAEQGLLGTILCDNAAYARVCDFLRSEHFFNGVHARIYAAVEILIQRGDPANPVTLHAKFEYEAALSAVGGPKYLARLAESAVTLINAVHYARAIVEAARRRELVIACEELTAQALLGATESEELIDRQRSDLLRIGEIGRRATDQITIDPAALQGSDIPERAWVSPGWIPDFHVTGISGAGGIGKSLLAQQLCTAAALGASWIGQPVNQRRSLYFACEDSPDELHRRQADINQAYRCQFADLGDVRWLARLGHDNLLMTFSGGVPSLTAAYASLLQEARSFGAKLVVVDTAADTFGGNESDRGQVRQYIQACLGRLAREIGGAVVMLSHPSRSGQADGTGQSGSTGWDASVRSRLYLAAPKGEADALLDPDLRELARKKSNYAGRDDLIGLRWVDGVFIATQQRPAALFAAAGRQRAERIFLELLDKLTAEGQRVSHNDRASNYAPKLFARRPEADGLRKTDFETSMHALFSSGRIVVGQRRAADRKNYDVVMRAKE